MLLPFNNSHLLVTLILLLTFGEIILLLSAPLGNPELFHRLTNEKV